MAKSDLLTAFEFANLGNGKGEISIRGTIGVPRAYADYVSGGAAGTLAEFERELKALGNVSEITLRVFSRGGDIFTAMAIHDLLAAHPAKITAKVDGLAASAATWLMAAADEVQMPANAWYFMHNVQTYAAGDFRDLQKAAREAEKFTADLARVYQARMRAAGQKTSAAAVREMMNVETWLNGEEAKALGLVDTVLDAVAMTASLDGVPGIMPGDYAPVNMDKVPEALRGLFDTRGQPDAKRENMKPRPIIQQAAENGGASGPGNTPPAPTNQTPPPATPPAPAGNQTPAPATPPAPATSAPVNVDLSGIIANAVAAATAPLVERLANLEKRATLGITPENLAGSPPAAIGNQPPAANTMTRKEWNNLSPAERAAFIRKPGNKLVD